MPGIFSLSVVNIEDSDIEFIWPVRKDCWLVDSIVSLYRKEVFMYFKFWVWVCLFSKTYILKYLQVSVSYTYEFPEGLYIRVSGEAVLVCKDPYLLLNYNIY